MTKVNDKHETCLHKNAFYHSQTEDEYEGRVYDVVHCPDCDNNWEERSRLGNHKYPFKELYKLGNNKNKQNTTNENNIKDKQLKILSFYGVEKQLDMLVEECSELIKEVMKLKRNNFTTFKLSDTTKLVSEIADVINAIDLLKYAMDIEYDISVAQNKKLDREIDKIKQMF